MTNPFKILCVLSLASVAACAGGSSGTTTTTTGGTPTTGGTTTGGGIPAVPALGNTEVDRMGRGAVNTALTAPLGTFALFDGGELLQAQAKDYYNSVSDAGQWEGDFAPAFVGSLAVYDALDGVCGNQLAEGKQDGGPAGAYGTLAAVLTDDQLYVDTTVATCSIYLAVELEFVKAIPAGTDCGGRTPLENIIDETYSALAIGKVSGVTNGITSKLNGTAQDTTFPFLGAP
jgi:hypothetical protein